MTRASIANFVCKFGDQDMVDYLQEIVLPAFTDDTLVRSLRRTNLHFYDLSVEVLEDNEDEPVLGICGRFVKDTTLERTQYYAPDRGIVKDSQSLQSSPTAFFVLILNNHKLIYMPKTKFAPTIDIFKSTVSQFLDIKHYEFIRSLKTQFLADGKKVSLKELRSRIRKPRLEILPLTGAEDIDSFIDQFSKLTRIKVRVIKTNQEIVAKDMLKNFRDYLAPLYSTESSINIANTEGLNKSNAAILIHDVSATGNQEAILTGIDKEGNKLHGDNENFKVQMDIDPMPPTKKGIVKKLVSKFNEMKNENLISIDEQNVDRTVIRKLLDIRKLL